MGNLPPLTLDAADLSAEQIADLERLLAKADLSSAREAPPPRAGAPDAFRYELDVETAGQRHHFSLSDPDVPPGLRPLLTQLTRLGQERQTRRR